jgi:hypothetical protein
LVNWFKDGRLSNLHGTFRAVDRGRLNGFARLESLGGNLHQRFGTRFDLPAQG